MKENLPTTAERFRRARRDWEAYQRRSLYRRSHPRFQRDLKIKPHRFLAAGAVQVAELSASRDEIRQALRGMAVWTLDTALTLVSGHHLLKTGDLTGYFAPNALGAVLEAGLIGPPAALPISLDPIIQRPPLLVAHFTATPPLSFSTPTGDRVVTLDALKSDLVGTLGWRPDLLNRIEALYPAHP